ncbi:MAG: B12-binding domain-containing protein [Myxococcota bacterium]
MGIEYKFKGGDKVPVIDLANVRPYGDAYNDGMIQLSFTLPVPAGARGAETAKQLISKMGLKDVSIVHDHDLGEGLTYFIAYAKTRISVNYNDIQVAEVQTKKRSREEIDAIIKQRFNRDIVVVGACTGDDAHTVGIDAILNMKGVDHHYGLERYEGFLAYNLGSQVKNEELIAKAKELNADAILISQVVTHRSAHLRNLTNFIELAEAEGIREKMILIIGGPRITHKLALELGFDAGFGKKTYPEEVASFIIDKLEERGRKSPT